MQASSKIRDEAAHKHRVLPAVSSAIHNWQLAKSGNAGQSGGGLGDALVADRFVEIRSTTTSMLGFSIGPVAM